MNRLRFFLYLSLLSFYCISLAAQNGRDAKWESAGKQGIGTAVSLKSKIWFTLEKGSLTEVFYPRADHANVQTLQFIVVDPTAKTFETERENSTHRIRITDPRALSFEQINTARNWEIRKSYTVDPERNSVLINVRFFPKTKNLTLYVLYDPSINNSGMQDSAWTNGDALIANEADIFSAIKISGGFSEANNGFSGISDGLEQIAKFGRIQQSSPSVKSGNVTQIAKINSVGNFTLILSFSKTEAEAIADADASLRKGFRLCQREYQAEWRNYVRTLPQVGAKYQTQLNYAAMILKASEDKTFRGGNVASLSKPWITGSVANGPYVGGYHLVWSRDLYQVATAYMALGDTDAANRALDYLFTTQLRPDGSYPQISWLDGRTLGDHVQMDEVSYPIILAYQLGRSNTETYLKYIKPTADYIVKIGPVTQQERWEERPGYSPSTIAAEIAALVCAAEIARKNGDKTSSNLYLKTADDWEQNVEKWTATSNGKYGDGNYYLRLTKNGTPDANDKIELNNNAGTFFENEIVDAGFLELVRFGIKSPDDKLIKKSLAVVDSVLKVDTPHGEGFFRYNNDGYGEMYDGRPWNWDSKYTGKGHLWALLSGERGQYEIAECGMRNAESQAEPRLLGSVLYRKTRGCVNKAKSRLDSMLGFANDGFMIPEQVWDKPNSVFEFGEGAGSATPLAWSMAQFIRLTVNLKAGRNLDTPDVVARRYGNLK